MIEKDISNTEIDIPKKRGRKPKNQINMDETKEVEKGIESDNEIQNEDNGPKKRGRKPKNKEQEEEVEKIPKKRGRKPKEKVYSIKELPKTFYEENKNETLILHLPINIENKEIEPKPLEEENNNYNVNNIKEIKNEEFNLPTQINFLEPSFQEINNEEVVKQNISTTIEKNNKVWEVDQKNSNKILKKNLRNILYEFIDCNKEKTWPEKTNINCWWCCHNFDNTPCSLPYKYKKEKFHVKGVFCCFNCAASYNFSLNDEDVYERYSLLNLMYKKLYY